MQKVVLLRDTDGIYKIFTHPVTKSFVGIGHGNSNSFVSERDAKAFIDNHANTLNLATYEIDIVNNYEENNTKVKKVITDEEVYKRFPALNPIKESQNADVAGTRELIKEVLYLRALKNAIVYVSKFIDRGSQACEGYKQALLDLFPEHENEIKESLEE